MILTNQKNSELAADRGSILVAAPSVRIIAARPLVVDFFAQGLHNISSTIPFCPRKSPFVLSFPTKNSRCYRSSTAIVAHPKKEVRYG